MNVTACLVTRGNVDMAPVIASLPRDWEILVWNNGKGRIEWCWAEPPGSFKVSAYVQDLGVYGRYACIEYAKGDLIYVQDDDCIVSDPAAIVWESDSGGSEYGRLVCNMPQEFRPHYPDSALVGFGACFHRDLPSVAFDRLAIPDEDGFYRPKLRPGRWTVTVVKLRELFLRECDTIFTTLTPRILVDVPKTDREFASDPDRLWTQPEHVSQRQAMLKLARQVRDGS